MQNKFFGSKLNTALLLVLIILMIIALKWMFEDRNKYWSGMSREAQDWAKAETRAYEKYNNKISGQASWFVPNQTGWVIKTLEWKKYNLGSTTFSYPSNYIVSKKKVERRPGTFAEEVTISDPNSRTDTPDAIYIGVPYTGASDPNNFYEVKENVNGSGVDLAISLQASNFAKYIFTNIASSVNK